MLEFPQERLSAGLALATLKVYMASISINHSLGVSVLEQCQMVEAYLPVASSLLGPNIAPRGLNGNPT